MSKPKWLLVLEALHAGADVEAPTGHILALGENESGNDVVAIRATRKCPGKPEEEILLPFDYPINEFITLCEEIKLPVGGSNDRTT